MKTKYFIFVLLLLFGLGLAGSSAAQTTDPCCQQAAPRDDTWEWDPAEGPVTHYIVQLIFGPGTYRERTIVLGVTTETRWTVKNAHLWQPYAVQVFAVNKDTHQRGPTSPVSEVRYVPPPGCVPCCQ